MGPNPNMTGVLMKRRNLAPEAQGEEQMKTEVLLPQVKGLLEAPEVGDKWPFPRVARGRVVL